MSNTWFQFKQFIIHHDRCAMKIGTDAVLLGAWVDINNSNNILDIGSGSGIISIMMAQRSNATITGVEIEENAFKQSVENVSLCPWNNRISMKSKSFQQFAEMIQTQFDLIISNPPFFINSLQSTTENLKKAKHDSDLNFDDFLFYTKKIIAPLGKLAIILPIAEGNIFISKAASVGLFCNRKTIVKNKNHKEIRLLLEFSKYPQQLLEDILIINNPDGSYTDQYKKLTGEFYLNF